MLKDHCDLGTFARSCPERSERGLCPRNLPGGGFGGGQSPPPTDGMMFVRPGGILARRE